MPVIYHEESRNFHLFNEKMDSLDSYILGSGSETGRVLIIFWNFVTDQCLYVHLKMTVLFRWNISVKSIRLMAAEI